MIWNAVDVSKQQNAVQAYNKKPTAADIVNASFGTGKSEEENKGKSEAKETAAGVVVEISEQMKEMYQKQAEAAREAAENFGEGMEDLAKILEIARRISKGDHVPPGDEKKLMEFSSDLYQAAKASAMLHADEKHKKHKALFEEEDSGIAQQIRDLRREGGDSAGGADAGESAPSADASPAAIIQE